MQDQILANTLTLFKSGGWAYHYAHHTILRSVVSNHPPNRIFRPSYGPVMECAICMDLKTADSYPFSNGFTTELKSV